MKNPAYLYLDKRDFCDMAKALLRIIAHKHGTTVFVENKFANPINDTSGIGRHNILRFFESLTLYPQCRPAGATGEESLPIWKEKCINARMWWIDSVMLQYSFGKDQNQ